MSSLSHLALHSLQHQEKNSWVLRVNDNKMSVAKHHYFCACSEVFSVDVYDHKPYACELSCFRCHNDYFLDAEKFLFANETKIWKQFKWSTKEYEDDGAWHVELFFFAPHALIESKTIVPKKHLLLHVSLKKDGSSSVTVKQKFAHMREYHFFLDGSFVQLAKCLIEDAKTKLLRFIMSHKSSKIYWIKDYHLQDLQPHQQLETIKFFLKNHYLKEFSFLFWHLEHIAEHFTSDITQLKALDIVSNHTQVKSLKKALYQSYNNSLMLEKRYNPNTDYVFARSIDNIDLCVKLLEIHPFIKTKIFTETSLRTAEKFITFLKRHYTQKQIAKLFIVEMQDKTKYQIVIHEWEDSLRMLQTANFFTHLEQNFIKVKLCVKNLHDEIVRIHHIVSYKPSSHQTFDYKDKYVAAQGKIGHLDFVLPKTESELYVMSKKLNNCMFSYASKITKGTSIIYGIYKKETLLYAVELQEYSIVQAKGVSNTHITKEDMQLISIWREEKF